MEFVQCELSDQWRTNRLVQSAAQVLARPDGSTPRQIESWSDCKALCRLMDCDDISSKAGFDTILEELCLPFYARTGRSSIPPGVYFRMLLVIALNNGWRLRVLPSFTLATFPRTSVFMMNHASTVTCWSLAAVVSRRLM